MQVSTLDELKKAVTAAEAEIVVTDEGLRKKVVLWDVLRTVANVVVVIVLILGIFAWANPMRIPALEEPGARLVRQILLGVGILLLFAEYLLPVVRLYKPVASDDSGLKLVPRKAK